MLGILGLGNHSTAHCINVLNSSYKKKNGGDSTLPFILYNINFNTINPYLPFKYSKIENTLLLSLERLFSYDVTHVFIPNITINFILKKFHANIFKKVLNPLDILIEQLTEKNINEITFLGTSHLMKSNELSHLFQSNNIDFIKPKQKMIDTIDTLRLKVYQKGGDSTLMEMFSKILRQNINPIIGCTELSIINQLAPLDLLVIGINRIIDVQK